MTETERMIREALAKPVRPAASNLPALSDNIRQQVERQEAVQGQVIKVHTFVHVTGVGEASVDVDFSARFIEKPLLSCGAELDENQSPIAGNFPTVSAMVANWKFEELDKYRKYYVGATYAIVLTGKSDQKTWVHLGVEGRALLGPGGGAETAE